MTIRQFTSDPVFRQRYWARNHVGWRHMDETLPNAGHRALAALEHAGVVSGVITQNVDLLHTKAGSRNVVNLHGTYAEVICLDCGHTMTRAALAELLEAANPGFVERAEAVGGIAVAPDADAVVGDTSAFTIIDCTDLRWHAQTQHRLLRRERAERPCGAGVCDWSTKPTPCWWRARRLRCSPDSASCAMPRRCGIPVAIINRGRTRGDDLATVKIDAGCSPMLALLADELPIVDERMNAADVRSHC